MSLSKFHQSPSPAKSPLEEITESKDINETIRDMLSPERIDTLVKRRPCLVLEVDMNEDDTNRIYTLLAVTHFDGKTIFETDIHPDKRFTRYRLLRTPLTSLIELHWNHCRLGRTIGLIRS